MPTTPVTSVTTAPVSARDERAGRTRRYLIMMGIRTACFLAAFVVEGWMRLVCIGLAVVLPYIAVVLANSVAPRHAPAPQGVMASPRRQLDSR